MLETVGRERENKIHFIISAYHDVNGKEESVEKGIEFLWKTNDHQGATSHALEEAFKEWPTSEGYYDHYAVNV